MNTSKLKIKQVCRALEMWPQNLSSMEARGILPDRKNRGEITDEWLHALLVYHLARHGELSEEAKNLFKGIVCDQGSGEVK